MNNTDSLFERIQYKEIQELEPQNILKIIDYKKIKLIVIPDTPINGKSWRLLQNLTHSVSNGIEELQKSERSEKCKKKNVLNLLLLQTIIV